jgi:pimeloyl-ACP methyl ester carboxylesterase
MEAHEMKTQSTNDRAEKLWEMMDASSAARPIWLEALAPAEWVALHFSPVYYGRGVRKGHDEPVVVVPGFLSDDSYLAELHDWLQRIGYRAYYSGIGRNADCPARLARRLVDTVRRAYGETGKRVTVVGHSLGGMLARTAAQQVPDLIRQVITVGSPARAPKAHPVVLAAAAAVKAQLVRDGHVRETCGTVSCACDFAASMRGRRAARVRTRAIYSKLDGVVDWRCCVEDDPACNRQVTSTHSGMVFNAEVYRTIGEWLAEAA